MPARRTHAILRIATTAACLWALNGQAIAGPEAFLATRGAATLDRNCAALSDTPAPLPDLETLDAHADDQPVPPQLHQVWFGAPHPIFAERMRSWQRFAAAYGYGYKLWQVDDLDTLKVFMSVANAQALAFYLTEEDYRGASDLVRLTVLDMTGGIYLDSDLQPPSDDSGFFDLDAWLPMRGVTAISENEARHTGEVGTFLTNCFLSTPGGHPLLAHLVDTVAQNHHAWCSTWRREACYATGPWLLTRALNRAVNVVPMDEGYAWRLFGHTRRPDAHAWPSGHMGVPQPAPAPAPTPTPTGAEAEPGCGGFPWLPGGSCLGGRGAPPRQPPSGAAMAASLEVAGPVDCQGAVEAALAGWRAAGALGPAVLDQVTRARMLGRCVGRDARRFSRQQMDSWTAQRRAAAPAPGDSVPDHPVPPGRRHPGGPDRAHPDRSPVGDKIANLLHMVELDDGADPDRRLAWQAYADRHGFVLRVWSRSRLPQLGEGVAGELLAAVRFGLAARRGPATDAALARGLGLAALADQGGALIGPRLTPPHIDLRRLVPWRNAAIIASPHSPTYRGVPADLLRLDRVVSEVLFDSGRGQALGGNATCVYPDFLAAAPGHRWLAALARQATADVWAMAADGHLPAGLVLGEAALSRSLGGPVTLLPMRLAVHAGLVAR